MKSTDVCELRLQLRDEVEHLGLDRRVEPGRRLVEDQQRRILGERHRDHDALLHAAGELVRVPAACTEPGSAICTCRARRARARAPRLREHAEHGEHLGDLRADADRRVQCRAGVLVDHRDRASRAQLAQLARRRGARRPGRRSGSPPPRPGRCAAGSGRSRARPSTCRSRTRRRGRTTRRGAIRERDAAQHLPVDRRARGRRRRGRASSSATVAARRRSRSLTARAPAGRRRRRGSRRRRGWRSRAPGRAPSTSTGSMSG